MRAIDGHQDSDGEAGEEPAGSAAGYERKCDSFGGPKAGDDDEVDDGLQPDGGDDAQCDQTQHGAAFADDDGAAQADDDDEKNLVRSIFIFVSFKPSLLIITISSCGLNFKIFLHANQLKRTSRNENSVCCIQSGF